MRGKVKVRKNGDDPMRGDVLPTEIHKLTQSPCLACGSTAHALLVDTSSSGRLSNTPRYGGYCPIVILERVYKPGTNEVDIAFWLRADRFARDCNYDLDIARSRMPHSFVKEGEGILCHAESFYNEVRVRCLSNGWTESTTEN